MSNARSALAGLAAAGLLLCGCSAQTPSLTDTPAPTPATSSSPAASSTPEAAASPTGAVPAAAKNACSVIDQAQLQKIVGAKLAEGTPQTDSGGSLCAFGPVTNGTVAAALLAGPTQGSLEAEVKSLSGRTTAPKVSTTTVEGADEAVLLTATTSSGRTTAVFATKGAYTFGGSVRTKTDTGSYEAACKTMVAALIKA